MIKILGGVSVILTVLLVIAGMHIKNLGLKIDNMEQQARVLKDAVRDANAATDKMTNFAEAARTRANDYEKNLADIREKNSAFQIENLQLRSLENDKALQNPLERGLASADRMGALWLRIENNPYSGFDYFNSSAADDPPD